MTGGRPFPQVIIPPDPSGLPGGTVRNSAFVGGGQLGFNWQLGYLVVGVEGDVDAMRISSTLRQTVISLPGFAITGLGG